MKTTLKRALLVLLSLILVISVFGCNKDKKKDGEKEESKAVDVASMSKEQYLTYAALNCVRNILPQATAKEITDVAEKAAKQGTVSVALEDTSESYTSKMSAKVSYKKDYLVATVEGKGFDGADSELTLKAFIDAQTKEIAAKLDAKYDGDDINLAYGADISKAKETLKDNSAVNEEAEQVFDEILDLLNELTGDNAQSNDIIKFVEDEVGKIGDKFTLSKTEHDDGTSVMTFKVTNEKILEYIPDVAERFLKLDSVKDFIVKTYNSTGSEEKIDVDSMINDMLGNLKKELENTTVIHDDIDVKCYINAEHAIYKIDAGVIVYKASDIDNGKKHTVEVGDDYKVTLTVTEKDGVMNAVLDPGTGNENDKATLSWNFGGDGKWAIALYDGSEEPELEITGKLKTDNGGFEFAIDMNNIVVSISYSEKVETSEFKKFEYRDIFTLDNEELGSLVEFIERLTEQLGKGGPVEETPAYPDDDDWGYDWDDYDWDDDDWDL